MNSGKIPGWMRREAFTLIELLCVIAVIGVLAAILMPVLKGVTARSRQVQCTGNLKQIGAAILLYTNDNNGQLPGPQFQKIYLTNTLPLALDPYTGQTNPTDRAKLWTCPANAGIKKAQKAQTPMISSYMAHNNVFGYPAQPGSAAVAPYSLTTMAWRFPTPDQRWMLEDIDSWNYPGSDTAIGGPTTPVHSGSRNVLYADGRVSAVFIADSTVSP
ncbi:MAG: type II secretion system protein [Rhodospirillales bacterium]|nr:type II secretion system protein [Acetobacter sp.]